MSKKELHVTKKTTEVEKKYNFFLSDEAKNKKMSNK